MEKETNLPNSEPERQKSRKRSKHKDIYEKYHYSSQQKLTALGLPPHPPPLERPLFSLLTEPPPPINPDKDWRMPLTKYRKAEKYPMQVATYEQSVLALSRKIREKSPCRNQDCNIIGHSSSKQLPNRFENLIRQSKAKS